MIEFIFLDLDDTILDFHRTEAVAIRKTLGMLLNEAPTDALIERYSEINLAQWKRLERGELTIEEVKTERFRLLFDELGVDIAPTRAQEIYGEELSAGHDMIDGAWAFLETLSSRYSLYIASNGDTYVQKRRIAESGIAHFFREIFISGELGAVKPKRAFFDACFERIPNFDPLRAIILGDSLTSDVAGGKNAGITACWFNPQKKPLGDGTRPDFEVASYGEFCALLERL